ncbi:MAG TPA: bifunctional diguanylate cyclase/phosphodiesterase [Caldithrix sp.]|nr:bifunctional diguanylate cyclase/phosphodiesterase [Caldithrix sp.]
MSVAASALPSQIPENEHMPISIPQFINSEEVREFFHDLPIEIAMYDIEGKYQFVNKCYASDEIIRKNLIGKDDGYLFNILGIEPDAAKNRRMYLNRSIKEKKMVSFTEKLYIPQQKRTLYYKRYFRPFYNNSKTRKITHVMLIGNNLNAAVLGQKELKYLAYHDRLTGLKNRTAFQDQLEQIQNEWERYEDQRQLAILFCDLDNFQFVNEELGHDVGDLLLKEVSDRLNQCVRKSDYVYRIDGDEFAVIVQNVDDEYGAGKIVEKINSYLSKPYQFNGNRIDSITTSMGIVLFPKDGKDIRSLVQNAETALYSAKRIGKNAFQFFSNARTEYSVKILKIEKKLNEMIKKNSFGNQLRLLYQPLVVKNLNDYRIFGSEVLVRWNNPELGEVRPETFIPVAEKTNLISDIGEWIFFRACEDYAKLLKKIKKPLLLSVNFSAKQLRSRDFIHKIEDILRLTDFDPKNLQLELTETSYLDDQPEVINNINELEKMGIKMALDDFGVGYASLSYLHKVPAATIKIDRSFIKYIGSSPRHRELVNSIILLGKNLNKEVVAEGVERVEDLYLLNEHKCYKYQGFLFSEAVTLEDMEKLMQKESLLSTIID